ncbi:hypothetical protein EDB80DRAFT_272115 [Ilyonectria destructans]|nr:hypothetical protein EDB80DRAFT_272115 [Ilyonectria destructans]
MRWPSVAGGLSHVFFVRHSNAGRQPRLQRRGLSGHRMRSNAYTLQHVSLHLGHAGFGITGDRGRLEQVWMGVGRGPWPRRSNFRGGRTDPHRNRLSGSSGGDMWLGVLLRSCTKGLFWRFWRHGIVMVIHGWLSWVDGWHVRLPMGIRLKGIRAIHAVDQN